MHFYIGLWFTFIYIRLHNTVYREALLHTDYDNDLYDWMQALTMWQNIRPQDTRSSMMPMVIWVSSGL
jgi:hypothetical protein